MYIEPNTTIKVLRNCPLDMGYENTILFDTPTVQNNYFNGFVKYTFPRNTFQRVSKGKMRVEQNAEHLYDCNYLMFQNTAYGTKWFYAFITDIEYINDVTSEITYELDLIQTWLFDYALEQCFVEREHSVTDEIGDNLVPENFETGEYISDGYEMPQILNSYKICIWCTFDRQYHNTGGEIFDQGYQEFYSGLTVTDFPLTDQGIADAIAWLADVPVLKIHGVVCVNIVPSIADNALDRTITVSASSGLRRLDGPIKNNKCFTYPYNFIYVTNGEGRGAAYRIEFFENTCSFGIFADKTPSSTVLLYPKNYKGVTDNFDERLQINGFPQLAYNLDAYKAWLAQSLSSIGTNAALVGLATGNVAQGYSAASTYNVTATALAPYGAAGALNNPNLAFIGGMTASTGAALAMPLAALAMKSIEGTIHAFMPPQAVGNQGGSVLLMRGILNFGIMHKYITREFATIIDDYFNMYGYACHRVKVPNIGSRPEWNYVKTVGCKIQGELPASHAKAIEGIFDTGIRFWHNPAHIGNYSYDNSPVSEG